MKTPTVSSASTSRKTETLTTITDEEIDMVMQRLNHRPRKRLGFLSPIQVLSNEGVALKT